MEKNKETDLTSFAIVDGILVQVDAEGNEVRISWNDLEDGE
jgi:hypothetical protein